MASNTGWVSLSERLMTPRTSEVAVCCSSDSLSSRVRACTSSNRRTFSIASRRFHERIEHRLQVERRTADDLEHVGGGRLPLQCLSKVFSRLGELAGSLIELLLENGRRGRVTTHRRWHLALFRLRRPAVTSFHC